jgi:hypothetical protein
VLPLAIELHYWLVLRLDSHVTFAKSFSQPPFRPLISASLLRAGLFHFRHARHISLLSIIGERHDAPFSADIFVAEISG